MPGLFAGSLSVIVTPYSGLASPEYVGQEDQDHEGDDAEAKDLATARSLLQYEPKT